MKWEELISLYKQYLGGFLDKDNDIKKGLVVLGRRGVGKTFNTIKFLKENNINYDIVRGYITDLQLYKKLFECQNKVLVLDDIVNLINDTKLQLLLASLDTHNSVVNWNSSSNLIKSMELPNSFEFNGKVIMLFNTIDLSTEVKRALVDRCLTFRFDLSNEELKNAMVELAKANGIPMEMLNKFFALKKDYSLRDLDNLKFYHKYNIDLEKALKVGVNDDLIEIINAIDSIEERFPNLTQKEKVQIFERETGFGRSTYYKYLKLKKERYQAKND